MLSSKYCRAIDKDRDTLECPTSAIVRYHRSSQPRWVSKLPLEIHRPKHIVRFFPSQLLSCKQASVNWIQLSVRGALFTWKRVHVTLRFTRGEKKRSTGATQVYTNRRQCARMHGRMCTRIVRFSTFPHIRSA